jgi:hypothetical protein
MGLPSEGELMQQPLKRCMLAACLICSLGLSATGLLDRGLDRCGLGYLSRVNESYLDTAFQKSLSGFLLLSSIKSGLAVVEGSEVGVGFNLELGDVVQPVYDYVDLVLAAVLLFSLLQSLTTWYLPQWHRLRGGLGGAVRFGASTATALYLLLPLSVTAAASLSVHITRPMLEASHEELRHIDAQIRPQHLNQQTLADMATEGLSGPSL